MRSVPHTQLWVGSFLLSLAISVSLQASLAGQDAAQELKENPALQAELKQLLQSKELGEQLEGIQRVGRLRSGGAPLLDELIVLLASENNDVSNRAALVIGAMGPIAIRAAPALIANMDDDQAKTEDRDYIWISFSRALFGLGPKSIPIMVDAIDSANHAQLAGICGALYDFGTAAKPALKKLIAKAEQDVLDSWPAMYVMEAIGKPSVEAMPLLLKSLKQDNFQLQVIACRVLTVIGPEAKAAKPLLHELMQTTGNTSARGRAAIALGSIGIAGGDDRNLLNSMSQLLEDPNQVVRERAVIGIGYLKGDALPVVENVRKAANDPKFFAKCEACVALWKITGEPKEPVERLIVLMDKVDYDLKAITALGEIGPQAVRALPALLKKMDSEDLSYALEGCQTISKMGKVAQEALPKLKQLILSDDAEVRIAARAAIEAVEER